MNANSTRMEPGRQVTDGRGLAALPAGKRPDQLTLAGPEGVSRLPILLRRAELRFDRAYAGAD
jgi:hypothetical protein